MSQKIQHFQYTKITIRVDNHEFTYNKFMEIRCKDKGITAKDVQDHLPENHNIHQIEHPETHRKGYLWKIDGTENENAGVIFPDTRGNQTKIRTVSSSDLKIGQLMELAPELFEYFP